MMREVKWKSLRTISNNGMNFLYWHSKNLYRLDILDFARAAFETIRLAISSLEFSFEKMVKFILIRSFNQVHQGKNRIGNGSFLWRTKSVGLWRCRLIKLSELIISLWNSINSAQVLKSRFRARMMRIVIKFRLGMLLSFWKFDVIIRIEYIILILKIQFFV